jgi:hypothetical protein
MSLSIFAGRNNARFRQLWTEQAKTLVDNLSLSRGICAALNRHLWRAFMGSLNAESSHALSSILLLGHENTSKIDLKVNDLISLPSIEKENYVTVYMIIT